METLMAENVHNSLTSFMYKNAIFLCERLCAQFPSEMNLQYLATCYLRNNQAYRAYHILKGMQMPQSRYLFAYSCYQMNLLREAEVALCQNSMHNSEVPNGAAGHYLLGLVFRYTGRSSKATEHFMQALAIDPLLWAAYEELCILGTAKEANECFSDSAIKYVQHRQSCSQTSIMGSEDRIASSSTSTGAQNSSQKQSKQPLASKLGSGQSLDGIPKLPHHNTPPTTQVPRVVPPPPRKNAQQCVHANAVGSDASSRLNANAAVQTKKKVSSRLFPGSYSGFRRSARLSKEMAAHVNSNVTKVPENLTNNSFSKFLGGISLSPSKMNLRTSRCVTSCNGHRWTSENFDNGRRSIVCDDKRIENLKTTPSSTAVSSVFDDGKHTEQGKVNVWIGEMTHDPKVINGIAELLRLLRILGEGYRLSCLHRPQDALEAYHKLSQHQYNTGWVLSQVGKAYSELGEYLEADRIFDLARRVTPYMLEGMDIYSSVLFQLKAEMKLSYLAQNLISTDRLSPQAWFAMGNCYSLQKDHETALKNFLRAVQLDSRFGYALTLCGHEYVAMEDYENGIKSYQNALEVDERDYKSWYGLGVVYLHQERFNFAEHHFQRALSINPNSSVIMFYLAMALHSLKRNEAALCMIEKAINADKKTPLPLYEKAKILVSLEKFDEALKILVQLKELVPRESSIYLLMGRIYKRFNMHEKAMFYFGVALDMKPTATDIATIKAAMEILYLPDELEEDSGLRM